MIDENKNEIVAYLRKLTHDIDDGIVEVNELSFVNDTQEVSPDGITLAHVATGISSVTITLFDPRKAYTQNIRLRME